MKKLLALLIPALTLAASDPAAAGDAKHKKACGVEATVCVRQMAETLEHRGWIGIEWNDTEPRPRITHVVRDSPADKAGVRIGDVVMAFEGVATDAEDEVVWAAMKRSLLPGKVITLSLARDGKPLELAVELIAVPEHIIAQWVGKHVLEQHRAAAEEQVVAKP